MPNKAPKTHLNDGGKFRCKAVLSKNLVLLPTIQGVTCARCLNFAKGPSTFNNRHSIKAQNT